MDMARNEVRKLAAEDYSTVQHLEHASRQARERNYQDFLIVDVDAHHYESESYREVFEYIENPVIRRHLHWFGNYHSHYRQKSVRPVSSRIASR